MFWGWRLLAGRDLHEKEGDDCESGGGVAGGGEAAGEAGDDDVGHQHDDGLGRC